MPIDLVDALVALISALSLLVVVFTLYFVIKMRMGNLVTTGDLRQLAMLGKLKSDEVERLKKVLDQLGQPSESATPPLPEGRGGS